MQYLCHKRPLDVHPKSCISIGLPKSDRRILCRHKSEEFYAAVSQKDSMPP